MPQLTWDPVDLMSVLGVAPDLGEHERGIAIRLRSRQSPRDEGTEITKEWVAEAALRCGAKVVPRGRPCTPNPKQLLWLRLPPEVIAGWKATGPGWQTRKFTFAVIMPTNNRLLSAGRDLGSEETRGLYRRERVAASQRR
jgi:uncharacterized protein (DUF4415 family)